MNYSTISKDDSNLYVFCDENGSFSYNYTEIGNYPRNEVYPYVFMMFYYSNYNCAFTNYCDCYTVKGELISQDALIDCKGELSSSEILWRLGTQ